MENTIAILFKDGSKEKLPREDWKIVNYFYDAESFTISLRQGKKNKQEVVKLKEIQKITICPKIPTAKYQKLSGCQLRPTEAGF